MKTFAAPLSLVSFIPIAQAQITFGYTDNFENGTVAGFEHGASSPGTPLNTTGGPAGASDRYLRVIADGFGDAGKLTVQNQAQWAGDYVSENITQIEMDLQLFSSPGNNPLPIRIALREDTGPGGAGYVSTTPFNLQVDGAWHHVTFSLSDMTAVNNPSGPLSSVLANVVEFRILQSAAPDTLGGPNVVAELGIDNISAVPEPASALTAAVLLLGVGLQRQIRRRSSRRA